MWQQLVLVAAGGALGSVARFLSVKGITHTLGVYFPFGTLVVNVAGSLLMGILFAALAKLADGKHLFLLLGTGFLGGFTTFSAFSLDSVQLIERGDLLQAFFYIAGSVLLCLLATFLGLTLTKAVF